MRIRHLLGGLAVIGVLLAGASTPAFAVEEEPSAETTETKDKKIGHAEEECIHILEGGGTVSECQEAPNPILPATNELVFGALSFFLLFGLMYKFAYPAVQQAMTSRTERIRGNLDEAERVKSEAQTVLGDYQRQLADAKNEANRIIDEARQTAEQLRRDLMERAEAEVAELRERSQEDIRNAQARAMADLKSQVSALAIELAEKVVERNLDRDTNLALIDSYINQVGAQRS